MKRFYSHDRFGRPQFLAGLLLLAFLGQAGWLVAHESRFRMREESQLNTLNRGLALWGRSQLDLASASPDEVWSANSELASSEAFAPEYDPNHSPIWYLIASAPLLLVPSSMQAGSAPWMLAWLPALPFLMFGVLLGASVWYVARRLYGNTGGYIALALYCFSPTILRSTALWLTPPEMGAAWGAFGAVFTAIAVSHTLYAPREVVLWNWRRILLLGLSFTLAVGSQFSLIILFPIALAFMLYLAPARKRAALAIWGAACGIATVLLFASYGFSPAGFRAGLMQAEFLAPTWAALAMPVAYREMFLHFLRLGPALIVGLPIAMIAYMAWRRTRYFGNTAPLLAAVFLLLLALLSPHYPGLGFELVAVPFLFVFVAGVAADLLESRAQSLVLPFMVSLIGAGAVWNVIQLAQLRG
jgi:hypothetical protein